MKKLLVILLSAIMVLSMIPAMALTASAAGEGIWTTRRATGDDDPDDYTPCGGYQYTSEGFQTISPDYTNTAPFYVVCTKEAQNMKDGFSMTFRIDEFDYKGENGDADEWITVAIWNTNECEPGNTFHGDGWLTLLRGTGDGSATCQSFWTEATDTDNGITGGFNHQGDVSISPELDSDEKEIYTVTCDYTDGAYSIKVCDVEVAGMSTVSSNMEAVNPDGNFYVSIIFHTTAPGGNASLTITETNGSKPTGSDSKEAEENLNVPGPVIDPDSIAANTPAAIFDANKTSFNKDPEGQNCIFSAKGDGTYSVQAATGSAFFWNWSIKASINADAQSFPICAMLVRNWMGSDSGTIYYCAGDVMGAGDTNNESWMIDWDYEWEVNGNVYDLIWWDGTGYDNYVGQIHGFRFDMTGITSDVEDSFDVCYIAVFKTLEDAVGYAENAIIGWEGEIVTEAPTEEATEAPTEEATEAPTAAEDATVAADETAADGETLADGETVAADATEASDEAESGCASVIGGSVALLLTAMAAAVALKKKN